jgi:uncharacterized damage-inducible protein DinB
MMHVSLDTLLDYTTWERVKWQAVFARQPEALQISVGSNGDGRFSTVGDVVRHIFSAEKRYVERLTGQPLTDPSSIPNANADGIFTFSSKSRSDLRQLIATLPADQWDTMMEMELLGSHLRATPRKIVIHILLHEIRHWAQIATLLRVQGVKDGFHDFLFSPVLGGAFGPKLG